MENKLILRLANGLGNQLFLYATAFTFAKKLNYKLELDDKSGFVNDDRNIKYELSNFNISSEEVLDSLKFNTKLKNLKRIFLKKKDKFTTKKTFLIEKRDKNKDTYYSDQYLKAKYNNIIYMEGYFQSEKYFNDCKLDILKEFTFKDHVKQSNMNMQKKIIASNSVALHIRQHAFSETASKKSNAKNLNKSKAFKTDTINHAKKAINYFKNKTSNPLFFIFSNDFTSLSNDFIGNDFIFVNDKNNKPIHDFYLMHLCKHFIVSPSTFSWWAAWLSRNNNKICITPPTNIVYSNNKDVAPKGWIKI